MMIKFWSICQNTFLQTIRQPIYGVLIILTFAILALDVPLTAWTVGTDYHTTDQKMLENLGLSTLLVSSLLIAAFAASSALTREIEDRTALTVISKPVSRATFLLGKYAGVAAAVAVAFYLSTLVFLMTIRHHVVPAATDPIDWPVIVFGFSGLALVLLTALGGNFLFGWSFVSAATWSAMGLLSLAMGLIAFIGKEWTLVPFGQDIRGQLLVGVALMFMAVLILAAVAVAASARLGQVMTLLACFAIFFLGSMHPYLFGRHQPPAAPMLDAMGREIPQTTQAIPALRVLGWLLPNLTYFYALDALTMDKPIPAAYVLQGGLYCLLYVGAVLAVGIALFHGRELEAQGGAVPMPAPVILLAWAGRACAIALAVAAAAILSLARHHTPRGYATAGGLLAAGAAAWVFWGCFARGARWSYWLALLLTGACCLAWVLAMSAEPLRFLTLGQPPYRVVVQATIAAAVLLILLLPRTRRHFYSVES